MILYVERTFQGTRISKASFKKNVLPYVMKTNGKRLLLSKFLTNQRVKYQAFLRLLGSERSVYDPVFYEQSSTEDHMLCYPYTRANCNMVSIGWLLSALAAISNNTECYCYSTNLYA